MSVVEAGLPLVGTEEAVECALCEHHRHEPVTPGALTRELRRLLCDRM